MFHFQARTASVSLVAMLSATTAWADLTAEDVWSDWKSYLEGAGYDISATEQRSGNSLSVSDFEMTIPIPEGDGSFTIGFAAMSFTEQGDGTVAVNLPADMPVRLTGTDGGETFDVQIAMTQTGQTMNVSGSPSDMLYTYSAATMGLKLDGVTVDGTPLPPEVARFVLNTGALTSTTKMSVGGMRSYDQQMSIDGVNYDFAFSDPDTSDRAAFTGSLAKLNFSGGGSIPLQMDPEDVAKMLKDGLAFSGSFDYQGGSSRIAGTDGSENFSMQSSSEAGRFEVGMDAAQLSYDLSSTGAKTNITSGEFPFPISLEMAKAGMSLMIPVGPGEAEQDFAFGLNLTDFKMADILWGLFDPGAVLPRDPATIDVDMTGKAKVFADIFAPGFPDNLQGPPGELNAVSLNNVLVSMVGAQLTGSGAFTFDNTDLTSFDGLPRPSGSVELSLKGGNGLLDNLTKMGLVGDQEAMGARMMMGMLAVPGNEPDTLNSKIEINDQGHILANGQRIQ